MRPALHAWFVVGVSVPVVALLLSLVTGPFSAQTNGTRVTAVSLAAIVLMRVVFGLAVALPGRRQRPHELFTPLYDQQ